MNLDLQLLSLCFSVGLSEGMSSPMLILLLSLT